MASIFSKWWGKNTSKKEVPKGVAARDFAGRGAISKSYRPYWIYKPPFGVPHGKDVETIRRLGLTPAAFSAKKTVIDELDSIKWSIVPKQGFSEDDPTTAAHIQEVEEFFNNPNTNNESWNTLQKKAMNDILDLNSGIFVKEFNSDEKMVEVIVADSGTFLKNPDAHGKYTEREDLLLGASIQAVDADPSVPTDSARNTTSELRSMMTITEASKKAAYFQFGWGLGNVPIPFGKREIVWITDSPTTYDIYGKSPIEVCLDILQTLIWSIEYYREFFENNSLPKGFFSIKGATDEDVEAFMDRWLENTKVRDHNGLLRSLFHRVPAINAENAEFKPIQLSSKDLDLIANTTLFQKLLWANLGVTSSEMGFTEDSNKATDLSQSRLFRKKAVYPRLRMLEYFINSNIVSEFGYDDVEFKYNTFDVDEELSKSQLYKVQIDSGQSTVNEVRAEVGKEPIEGGDELLSKVMFSGNNQDPEDQEKDKEDNGKGEDRTDSQRLQDARNQKKALDTNSPVVLGENELISPIKNIYSDAEKRILEIVRREARQSRLSQINAKSLPQVLQRIEQLFSTDSIKELVKKITNNLFMNSFNKTEKQLSMNLQANSEQIKFLSNYTFDNIKGLEQDTKSKLRQVLTRAIVEGHGIGKIVDEIKSVFDVTNNRAEMIARTETNRAENYGQLNALKTSGRKVMKYVSVHEDERTSGVCMAIDRKYGTEKKAIPLDDNFVVMSDGKKIETPSPPFHVNCRSALLFKFV